MASAGIIMLEQAEAELSDRSSRLLYAGECKGTNILCYLVNKMPACYHKYRKKEGTGVL